MKLSEIAAQIQARLEGPGDTEISSVASLAEAGPGEISFLTDRRYAEQAAASQAAAIIVPDDFNSDVKAARLYVKDVNNALEQILVLFGPRDVKPLCGVHPSADIAEGAALGKNVSVGAYAVIGKRVTVGDGTTISAGCILESNVRMGSNCYLAPNVVIRWGCVVGNQVIINANCTIGTDGFGYRLVQGQHRKIPHIGIVVIEDDVEIGANCCLDRAKIGKTVVGRGTKIDNLVQIAHNVQIGRHCVIAAQVGIAGSSQLGDYVALGGQVAVSDHVKLGNGVMVGGQCGIISEVESGAKIMGSPHRPIRSFFREQSLLKKLPEMAREIKQLRKQLETRGSTKNHSESGES